MAELKKVDNAFIADDIGDVKPKVKIGGSDKSKFVPNLNASFFDDEYYCNFNRKDKAGASSVSTPELGGDDTDQWYIDTNGCLKWDIVWNSLPDSLSIEWEIKCSNGLDFCYQRALTQEEKDRGKFQSEEAKGSYAVYCDKMNNKYKTGKLFHIYRPFIVDVNGVKAWCSLSIANKKMTITLPDSIKTMTFPVRLDPTINYTSIGGSIDAPGSGYTLYSCYNHTMPSAGTASRVYVYQRNTSTAAINCNVGYYTEQSGYPSTLRESGAVSYTVSTGQWSYRSVSGTLVSGTAYDPAAQYLLNINYYYDSGTGTNSWWGFEDDLANSPALSTSNAMDARFSMYIEYTASGGGIVIPIFDAKYRRHRI